MSYIIETKSSQGTSSLEWLPVAAGLLVLYVPTFYGLATTIWKTEDQAHGPIILAVILWLIWDRRHALFAVPTRTAPGAGFTLLVVGLLFYTLGRSQDILLFEIGALAPILAGTLLVTRGWLALRALWFPVLFIAFLVPLPGFLVDALTGPLKQSVSAIAEQLLYAAGYPIARNGVVLTVGQYQLLVADACSGINSMFSLSALGALYLYLMRYKSWLHNGLLLASILPIAFCANIVRVMTLVLVTYYFGDAVGQGFAHNFAGMALFVVALMILFGFDALLRLAGAFFGRKRKA
ncbi:MAG: exosortase B [Betaproteobacteria bacterium RIFCSPLOWO2_12_FULL_62_13]|nr:MAG: exosortase B [Betaproteobacteria bacterium RIFCSPLOWO2_12_FULL_62_13]